jgi:Fe-S oxidoreductase
VMIADPIAGGMLLLAAGALAVSLAWRSRYWLAGRPEPVPILKGLFRAPRRYLVHVHEAVTRDPLPGVERDTGGGAARMHMLAAGGFVAASLMILIVHVLEVRRPAALILLFAALATMAAGTALVFRRRLARPLPARLSRGSFDRLPWALTAFIGFFTIASLPAAGVITPLDWSSPGGIILLVLGGWACLVLYAGVGARAMRHATNGLLHLAFHPRPGRFDGGTDTAAKPLDLEEDRLGVARPTDFRWNQLLSFDACVQCGRCEAACPAFAAGLPLNPKKLIQDLAAAERPGAGDGDYAGNGHPGRSAGAARGGPGEPVIGSMVHPDTLWACTTCLACVYECPMMIEHVDAVLDLRRHQTLELGATPGKAAGVLEELQATDTVSGRALKARLDWGVDLRLPVLEEGGNCEVLLWIGEGGFELRSQGTLRALVKLLRRAQVDFAVLGEAELDCGHLARRLGDEAVFQDLARRNIAALQKRRFECIVTADPHALHTLRNEYPDLGGRFAVEHHTTLLARLVREGRLQPGKSAGISVTYHDPCYLGRYNREFDAPRELLAAVADDVREMPRSGPRSLCCGWGGGASYTDVPGKRRIPDVRMDQIRDTGAHTVAVACPNCAVMLEGVVPPRPRVADVAELLADAVGEGE